MEKITTKKARELLVKNQSHFCGVINKQPLDYIALQIDNYEKDIDDCTILGIQEVITTQSSMLQFTGGSCLDLYKSNCYKFNKYIVVSTDNGTCNMIYRLEV